VQTFLSACAGLLTSLPALRLFLVGTTDDERYLASLRPPISDAARRVVTSGKLPPGPVFWSPALPVQVLGHREDAAQLVAAFDVAFLCSHYEGLPYAALEAMACEVPMVASDVSGCRDAVEHEGTGLLVPPGRAALFAQAAARLLADPSLRRRLGAAARERVAERFTRERFLRETAALYESLLANT